MDNEMLEAMGQLLDKKLAPVLADIKTLKMGQSDLQTDMGNMKADISAIKLTLENDIPRQFNLLTEGHKGLSEKLSRIDDMANDIEEMKGSIVAVEALALHK